MRGNFKSHCSEIQMRSLTVCLVLRLRVQDCTIKRRSAKMLSHIGKLRERKHAFPFNGFCLDSVFDLLAKAKSCPWQGRDLPSFP